MEFIIRRLKGKENLKKCISLIIKLIYILVLKNLFKNCLEFSFIVNLKISSKEAKKLVTEKV